MHLSTMVRWKLKKTNKYKVLRSQSGGGKHKRLINPTITTGANMLFHLEDDEVEQGGSHAVDE